MSLESVLITAIVDAYEGRYVAVVDNPGVFLSAYMDKEVIMTLRGQLVELMVIISPSIYKKHATIDWVQQVLYVSLQKALYGCLRSALLFYEKLVKELNYQVFVINPYDPCVANCTINVKHMTITRHADYLKISHVDKKEVTK